MNVARRMMPLIFAALAASSAVAVKAQTTGAVPGLPSVPTTKVLAIGRITGAWTPDALTTVMPQEVRETVRLYLDGRVDQWFVRKDQRGVVFILNVASVAEANRLLEDLPLGRARLMDFDLIPLGPLAPLGLLLAEPLKSDDLRK